MLVVLYALVTVLAWGTWIGVAQLVRHRTQHVKTFYVTVGNLILALVVLLSQHPSTSPGMATFWLPLAGGVVWALGNYFAFLGTANIGIARASGLWTPLNIAMGFVWGTLLFGQPVARDRFGLGMLALSIVLILTGILTIVFVRGATSGPAAEGRRFSLGLIGAVGAGVLWGTYFVPVEASNEGLWRASLPLAAGMAIGGAGLLALGRSAPLLERGRDYVVILLAGVLWGTGNYGMLLLAGAIGTGRGFAIAQLSLLVNAGVGIAVFKEPRPRSMAAAETFVGIVLAGIGGVILGTVR